MKGCMLVLRSRFQVVVTEFFPAGDVQRRFLRDDGICVFMRRALCHLQK